MAKEKAPAFVDLSVWDAAIVGGKDSLPENERGNNDTATDKAHPLYDERLKRVKMSKEWVDNIDANGVKVAPKVVFLDPATYSNLAYGDPKGHWFVVDGRERIRGGRLVSKRHNKDVIVRCQVSEALDAKGMINDMIALNVHHEDPISVKIAKAKRAQTFGHSPEDVARMFSVKKPTVDVWFQYDKTAIPAVKKAVDNGQIPAVTGFDIARSGNAEVQEKALEAVLKLQPRGKKDGDGRGGGGDNDDGGDGGGCGGERKGQSHAAKRAIARAAGERPHVLDKRTLKKLLMAVRKHELPKKVDDRTAGWWAGMEDALCFILGADPSKDIEPVDAMLIAIDAELMKNGDAPTPSSTPETKSDEDKDDEPGDDDTEDNKPEPEKPASKKRAKKDKGGDKK